MVCVTVWHDRVLWTRKNPFSIICYITYYCTVVVYSCEPSDGFLPHCFLGLTGAARYHHHSPTTATATIDRGLALQSVDLARK